MEEFIANYPGVAKLIGYGLLIIIAWIVKKSYDRLSDTLTKLTTALDSNAGMITGLEKRMSTQETICELCRKHCPYHLGKDVEATA